MNAAEKLSPTITERMTWAEICERFPDSYVSVVDIQRNVPRGGAIRSGRMVGHGKTRRESLAGVEVWWKTYPEIGHYFTGRQVGPLLRPEIVMTDEIRALLRSSR